MTLSPLIILAIMDAHCYSMPLHLAKTKHPEWCAFVFDSQRALRRYLADAAREAR